MSKELNIDDKEKQLNERLQRLEKLEADIRNREKQVKEKEKAKKQILLRLSPSLWEDLAKWADDDYRSINSQIEFILAEAVRKRKE